MAQVRALRRYRPIGWPRDKDPLNVGDVADLEGKALEVALAARNVALVEPAPAPKKPAPKKPAPKKVATKKPASSRRRAADTKGGK